MLGVQLVKILVTSGACESEIDHMVLKIIRRGIPLLWN
jgi:hypothetical protein